MALLLQNPQDPTLQTKKVRRRRNPSGENSGERTLVSPLALRKPLGRTIYWIVFALLALATLGTLGPIYWMFSGALKSSIEVFQVPPTFWPLHPQWSNYINAWNVLSFPLHLFNSLVLAAAYSLSKLQPTGKNIIQFLFFCTLMVPLVAYLIPQFVNISDLPIIHISLVDNWSGVLLPGAANAFNILVLKSFFDGIPNELTEAAYLDGANAWQLFIRIILPLSRPALAVITILTVIASWKDFLWSWLVLTDSTVQPLLIFFLHQMTASYGLPFNYLIAGIMLASLPPIILFLIFQRQIIQGINLTGLKD